MARILKNSSVVPDPQETEILDREGVDSGNYQDQVESPQSLITEVDDTSANDNNRSVIEKNGNDIILAQLEEKETQLIKLRDDLNSHKSELEQARFDACTEGEKQGYADGLKRAHDELEEMKITLGNLLDSIKNESKNKLLDMQDEIKEVIFSTVLKLTGSIPGEKIVEYELKEAIGACASHQQIRLTVSKHDYGIISGDERFSATFDNIELVADEKMTPGGCMIEKESESIDARLDNKIKNFKQLLVQI